MSSILRLVTHIFINLSQNICLINTHILIYWYARCDCKLWNSLRFYNVFWAFSYIIIEHSCLYCCISTKHSLIIWLINTHIVIYWHARCHSKLWKAFWFYFVFFLFFLFFFVFFLLISQMYLQVTGDCLV